jgi:cellulose biosynthesis protein BcsQ
MKLESIKQVDSQTAVHFFAPPESVLEYEEIPPEAFSKLIKELRCMDVYDIIFVDMSSDLNSRNIEVLASCDYILTVLPQCASINVRLDMFLREIDTVFRKHGVNLREKLIFLLNHNTDSKEDLPFRYAQGSGSIENISVNLFECSFRSLIHHWK